MEAPIKFIGKIQILLATLLAYLSGWLGDLRTEEKGLRKVLTANITSWNQAASWALKLDDNAIFVQTLQETRILREDLSSAAAMAKAAGWAGVFSQAEREGARGPGSAGLAILARSHLGIKEIVPPLL